MLRGLVVEALVVVVEGGVAGRRATSLRREGGRRSGIFLVLGRGGAGWVRMRFKGWEGSVGGSWRERVVEEVGEGRPLGEGGSAESVVVLVVMVDASASGAGAVEGWGSGGAESFWRFDKGACG